MITLFSSLSVLGGVVGRAWHSLTRVPKRVQSRRPEPDWAGTLARLAPLNRSGIAEVALDYLHPAAHQADPRCVDCRLEPVDIWERVGGMSGILFMERNVDVILDLAMCAQAWNSDAARVVECLRLEAKLLRRHLRKMRRADFGPHSEIRVPFYLQQATSLYYLMTRRLLALYQVSHAGLLAQLEEAV